jgi:hypothetical protein
MQRPDAPTTIALQHAPGGRLRTASYMLGGLAVLIVVWFVSGY